MPGQISSEMGALALAGIGIVFAVLALIAAVVSLFKRVDARWQRHEAALAVQSVGKTQNIDDTTLLLIIAAAATVVGGRFRVRRIHRLLPMRTKRTPWSSQGRLILQGSHSVTRKRGQR